MCWVTRDGHPIPCAPHEEPPQRPIFTDSTGQHHAKTARRALYLSSVGPLKYEHLYRIEIDDLPALARETETYRQIFNHIRPHQALGGHRPIEIYTDPPLHPNFQSRVSEPIS
ncbi:integrase core domain-containing protein [Actinomadura adrarensis]|uniref:Integrase core domain-containing protein n=1 Tax=Actinomadura adrarensis TaxID=1819600 RepID=A0ABW3CN87_9ACTN